MNPSNNIHQWEPGIIEICKRRIHHDARYIGFEFFDDDIVVARVTDFTFIFLRQTFHGYEEDENGELILDEDSNLIPIFKPVIWGEYVKRHTMSTDWEHGGQVEIPMPKVVCRCPELIHLIMGVKDDNDESI